MRIHHYLTFKMKQSTFSFLCILGIVCYVVSCKEHSIMDRSVYEDMTAKEVLGINDTLPSFRYFYDNIRSRIIAKSNDYDKEEYGKVTYNDMYRLFNYWRSSDFLNYVEYCQNSYNEEMAKYQVQVDSIAQRYRNEIDSLKSQGVSFSPSYDGFIKGIIPNTVYEYMRTQECSDLSSYLTSRKHMIVEYVNPDYIDVTEYMAMAIDIHLEEEFLDELALYNKAKMNNEKAISEFESYIGKATYNATEWTSPDLRLPITFPNGNYILRSYQETITSNNDILSFGETYYVSKVVSEDKYGNKTKLTFGIITYSDRSVSGQVIETSILSHRPGDENNYYYPIEGKWWRMSKHDKPVMRVLFELARSEQYYTIYIDEDHNAYINDLNSKPEKLYKR